MIVTDEGGREIEIKPLSMREQLDAAAALASPADGQAWWSLVLEVCAARKIGQSMIHPPQSRVQFRALKDRLGVAGVRAVRKGLREFGDTDAKPSSLTVEFRLPDEIETIDILEIGGRLTDIPAWRGIAFTAAGVRKVGDEALEFPATYEALLHAVDRLDEPALMAALSREPALEEDTADAVEEKAKN